MQDTVLFGVNVPGEGCWWTERHMRLLYALEVIHFGFGSRAGPGADARNQRGPSIFTCRLGALPNIVVEHLTDNTTARAWRCALDISSSQHGRSSDAAAGLHRRCTFAVD